MTHPSPDLLVALEEGVLPLDLASEVAQHVAECRVCAQLRRDLSEPELAEPSLAELEQLRKRVVAPPVRRKRTWIALAALAASLLIAAALLWPPQRETGAPLIEAARVEPKPVVYRLTAKAAPLRLPFGAALVLRGQETKLDEAYLKQLGDALAPYRAARYEEAAQTLEAFGGRYPKAVEPPFYAGVARLLAGDAARALPLLERAHAAGGEALEDDLAWYLAIARERNGQWDRALPLLQSLCKSEGPHRQESCQALQP